MSKTILSSPFLNANVLDSLLCNPALSSAERIQYLSAKLHLLVNHSTPSAPGHYLGEKEKRESIIQELELRVRLGLAYLALAPPDFHTAEAELGGVEKRCKGLMKRVSTAPASVEGGTGMHGGTTDEPQKGSSPAEENMWIKTIRSLRTSAIEGLIQVEDGLGRGARAERWKEVLKQIASDINAPAE